MNVPNIGQGPGSVAVLSRPQTAGVTPLPLRGPGSGASEEVAQHAPDSNATFVRIGWFDVNGDGHIDARSVLAGGDATVLMPHDVKVPVLARTVRSTRVVQNSEPARAEKKSAPSASAPDEGKAVKESSPAAAAPAPAPAPASDVQTRQAIDAYQRYGQATEPAPSQRAVA